MNNTKQNTSTMPAEFFAVADTLCKKFDLGFPAEVLYKKVTEKITAEKNTALSENDVYSFMLECKTMGLNPLAKQIYGFTSGGKLVSIISQDGWRYIANRDPNYDGFEVEFGPSVNKTLDYDTFSLVGGQRVKKVISVDRSVVEWIECKIYLKNRTRPVTFRSYFSESYRPTETWATQPIQRLQNKAFCNAVKLAFGISAYTEDDKEIIQNSRAYQEPIIEQQDPKDFVLPQINEIDKIDF